MCYSCLAIFPCIPLSHCIFHHLFAAAHYCETHRIHLYTYTCSFCLCPCYPARISGILSQTPMYALHCLSLWLLCSLLFCAYHLFIFLSTHSHYSSRPDICRLLIPTGFYPAT
ncbi:hypothetical protein EV363DRAFT_503144 [Boletus edulis]|nr:hypothetical protein EV363DRAFT_503144 [Boletus edulis]